MTGVPTILRTDGGPQFASSTLHKFLKRWDVHHSMSSPTYARANGHAESAIKIIEKLIMTTSNNRQLDEEVFKRGLLELRNTPRADGRSPAQVLFGHPLRSGIPTHHRAFVPEWQRAANECDAKAQHLRQQTKQRHNRSARPLHGIRIGSRIDIQTNATGLWGPRWGGDRSR